MAPDPTLSRLNSAPRRGPRRGAGRDPHFAGRQIIVDLDTTLVTAPGEGTRRSHVHARVRLPPAPRVPRPRTPWHRGTPGRAVARREGHREPRRRPRRRLDTARASEREGDCSSALARANFGGGTQAFLGHVSDLELQYSVGSTPRRSSSRRGPGRAELVPGGGSPASRPASRGRPCPATTGSARRPHRGTQLSSTDTGRWHIIIFATNTIGPTQAKLEVTHRLRAQSEDHIRALKETGLRKLPLHNFGANQISCELERLAADLLIWTESLAFTGTPRARSGKPRPRLRLAHATGRLVTTVRQRRLRRRRGWPWVELIPKGPEDFTPSAEACIGTNNQDQESRRGHIRNAVRPHPPDQKSADRRNHTKITKDRR